MSSLIEAIEALGGQPSPARLLAALLAFAFIATTAGILLYTVVRKTESVSEQEQSKERAGFITMMRRIVLLNLIALGFLFFSEIVRIFYVPIPVPFQPVWADAIYRLRPFVALIHVALPGAVLLMLTRKPKESGGRR